MARRKSGKRRNSKRRSTTEAERHREIEKIVDLLAEQEPLASSVVATTLGIPQAIVRRRLKRLESIGVLYREGKKSRTKWRLG